MDVGNWLTFAGIVLAILVHAFATIWWASKVSSTLGNILLTLVRIDLEFEKRDKQISKLWERSDNHSERLSSMEGKCNFVLNKLGHDKV